MARKDIENEHRAIDNRQRNDLFQILALPWAHVVKHEQQGRAELARAVGYFLCLSTPDQRRRIDRITPLHDAIEDTRSCRAGERFKFQQLRFERPPLVVRIDGDD